MVFKPLKALNLKKIDALIVIILIVVAGLVLVQAGYISPSIEQVIQPTGEQAPEDEEPIEVQQPQPPESIIPGYMRAVAPEDEGVHFDKISVCREWWYYTAVFDDSSDLAGWVLSVSFNHMARSDLIGTSKPDLLVVTLTGPDGEQYGGMINKERGFGILKQPTLQAKTPGVGLTFEDSWAEGEAPEWFIHIEDNEIDTNHEIIIDLRYFAPFDPLWTIGENAFDKTRRNLASYTFLGCQVSGTIKIDGTEHHVNGTGHHEHTWSPNIVTKGLINGWDWGYFQLENGWNVYYTTYYPTPQYISTKTTEMNPFGTIIITTNDGKTVTSFSDVNPEITESDDEIFTFVNMPLEILINSKPGLTQPILSTYNLDFNLDISVDNTYEKVWKFPTYVGMNVGRSVASGTLSWSDDDGEHELELDGIGVLWSMRALL